jgi:hypothetical protein
VGQGKAGKVGSLPRAAKRPTCTRVADIERSGALRSRSRSTIFQLHVIQLRRFRADQPAEGVARLEPTPAAAHGRRTHGRLKCVPWDATDFCRPIKCLEILLYILDQERGRSRPQLQRSEALARVAATVAAQPTSNKQRHNGDSRKVSAASCGRGCCRAGRRRCCTPRHRASRRPLRAALPVPPSAQPASCPLPHPRIKEIEAEMARTQKNKVRARAGRPRTQRGPGRGRKSGPGPGPGPGLGLGPPRLRRRSTGGPQRHPGGFPWQRAPWRSLLPLLAGHRVSSGPA